MSLTDARKSRAAFHPVLGSKASWEVVDQLTFAIASDLYDVGERLPTIPELSKTMKVSHPVVSDAIRILKDAGMLDVRRGNQGGITVLSKEVPPTVIMLSRPRLASSLSSVLEARRPVEIAIANLAIVHGTEQDFENLEEANRRLLLAEGNPGLWHEAHNAFHYAMGRASGNQILTYFQHQLIEELALLLDNFDERFVDHSRTTREHRDTLAALRTGDPASITSVMDQHLREFEELAEKLDARASMA
jgi:DNA-binding FadR family transcriptional regulator